MADLTLLADDGADTSKFFSEARIEIDDFVDGVVYLSCNTGTVYRQPRAEIALSKISQNTQKQTAVEVLHNGERMRLINKFFSHPFIIGRGRATQQGVGYEKRKVVLIFLSLWERVFHQPGRLRSS